MASSSKRRQTQAKHAREQALRDRRKRKEERRAARRAGTTPGEGDALWDGDAATPQDSDDVDGMGGRMPGADPHE